MSKSEDSSINKALEDQTFKSFDSCIRVSPNPIDAYNFVGVAFGKSGLYDKAIKCFEWVLSVQPEDEIARHNLAEAYSRRAERPH